MGGFGSHVDDQEIVLAHPHPLESALARAHHAPALCRMGHQKAVQVFRGAVILHRFNKVAPFLCLNSAYGVIGTIVRFAGYGLRFEAFANPAQIPRLWCKSLIFNGFLITPRAPDARPRACAL